MQKNIINKLLSFIITHKNILCFVISLIFIQTVFSAAKLNQLFLDGRYHVFIDNAFFLNLAKHSNDKSVKSIKKLAGVTSYSYASDGKIKQISHYNHHPVLSPALFRLYTKIFGYNEWVPRSFSLILSLLLTITLFLFLHSLTNNWLLSWLISLVFIFLPINYLYHAQMKYFHLALLIVVAYLFLLQFIHKSKYHRYAFFTLFFLSFHTDWPAYFAGFGIIVYLFFKRHDYKDLWQELSLIAAISILLNFIILVSLGLNPTNANSLVQFRLDDGITNISMWIAKQVSFINYNFSAVNFFVFSFFLLFLTIFSIIKKKNIFNNYAFISAALCFLMGFGYAIIFRNLSYIHHYLHAFYALSYILLITSFFIVLKNEFKDNNTLNIIGISLLSIILCFSIYFALKNEKTMRKSFFGKNNDIVTIKQMKKRIIYSNLSGPNGWWNSALISFYTNRIVKNVPWNINTIKITDVKTFNSTQDLIVFANYQNPKSIEKVMQILKERIKVKEFKLYKKTPSFSFYTFSF
ncbi:hypothetical protein ACFL2K_02175 [Candidatus Margulisiibacteriota bacterium]